MRRIGFLTYLVVYLQASKISQMTEKIQFLIHFFVMLAKLIRSGGIKAMMTENLLLKQQLLMLARQRSRSPRLTSFDRFLFGYLTFFISVERLQKISVILKPATI